MKKFYSMVILTLGLGVSLSFVNSAKIYLDSQNGVLISNCENNIDIMIDTEGEEIFGASVNMTYDIRNIEVVGLYLNDDFNLPFETKFIEDGALGKIESAELSMIRGADFHQIGFSGLVRYGTLVIKNKEPIENTQIGFVFDGVGSTVDNMDVFRLGDAKEILSQVEGKSFKFKNGVCEHDAPYGNNQLDEGYDYKANLDKNLNNIGNVEKMYKYKLLFVDYGVYGLMFVLLVFLIVIVKKRSNKNKKVLVGKEEKNV